MSLTLDSQHQRAGQTSVAGRLLHVLKHEFLLVLPPTIFFIIGFNLVAVSTNLITGAYLLDLSRFIFATTAALIVGKSVLVADKMPFLRRFDTAPLIRPILFKTAVYWGFVFVARLLEASLDYILHEGMLVGLSAYLLERFSWHRFAFIQLWILVLFLIYVTASEFNTLFGEGELRRILFRHSPTAWKLTRRQRIRTLMRLDRLTAGHSIAQLADPGSDVHRACIGLIAELAASRDTSAALPYAHRPQ